MNRMNPRPYVDPLIEAVDFRSELNGRDYEIRIGLPPVYHQTSEGHPVLVVLDAELLFGTSYDIAVTESMWSQAPIPGNTPLPQFIVVGISLPDRQANPFRRNFEYMPESDPDDYPPETRAYADRAEAMTGQKLVLGGAPVFYEVLTTEILPMIEGHYRVDDSRRVLFGQSAGGTFACYALLAHPGGFTDYIIASPGLMGQEIFQLESAWADGHDDLPAGVVLAAGERELADPLRIASGTAQLAEKLHSRRYPSLRLTTRIIPGASHVQAGGPSLARGLSELWT